MAVNDQCFVSATLLTMKSMTMWAILISNIPKCQQPSVSWKRFMWEMMALLGVLCANPGQRLAITSWICYISCLCIQQISTSMSDSPCTLLRTGDKVIWYQQVPALSCFLCKFEFLCYFSSSPVTWLQSINSSYFLLFVNLNVLPHSAACPHTLYIHPLPSI